jgi:hypothetical protein
VLLQATSLRQVHAAQVETVKQLEQEVATAEQALTGTVVYVTLSHIVTHFALAIGLRGNSPASHAGQRHMCMKFQQHVAISGVLDSSRLLVLTCTYHADLRLQLASVEAEYQQLNAEKESLQRALSQAPVPSPVAARSTDGTGSSRAGSSAHAPEGTGGNTQQAHGVLLKESRERQEQLRQELRQAQAGAAQARWVGGKEASF